MTREQREKLSECSEKINDIMAELSAIQKAEEDYKESIPAWLTAIPAQLTKYNDAVDRATDNCTNLRRCIFRLADCMADLEEFT